MKRGFLLLFALQWCFVFGQNTKPVPTLHIRKATERIELDGEFTEPSWQNAEVAKDLWQQFPADTCLAFTKTEVRVTYDDQFFYVAATCFDDLPDRDFVITSLKRDFSYPISDAFAVYIDPFNDKLNGFNFTVNPLGVQREGLLENGGHFGVTTSWDNKWHSKVVQKPDSWQVEMAIPFKTLRYKTGETTWGINFSRNDLKRNENSAWSPVPRNFNIGATAFTGNLLWDAPPAKAGGNISLIPYAIAGLHHDYKSGSPADFTGNIGGDAKVAVTSSLNLDLTVNPDFSQVEVDAQQTNLTQYSLFFPERRQFFIENSDLFDQFGFRQIRPFFSRRIGLHQGSPVPIIGGARLSGKLNPKLRIGLMNMQTAGDTSLGITGQNFSVAAFQQQVFGRSRIKGIFVNRQAFDQTEFSPNDYNRIAGLDFDFSSADNQWNGKVFWHQSFSAAQLPDAYAHASWAMLSTRKVFGMWNHEYVGKNYRADVGFVPRNRIFNPDSGRFGGLSYWRFEPFFNVMFYPKSKAINFHQPGIYLSEYLDSSFKTFERDLLLSYNLNFHNTSLFEMKFHQNQTQLFWPVDVTFTGSSPLPAGTYWWYDGQLGYVSDKRKRFSFSAAVRGGQYYSGNWLHTSGGIALRMQPIGYLFFTLERNEFWLPSPAGNTSLLLLSPKVELSFTKSLFFTTFIQYNTQSDNLNVNSRLQWRFAPMSDFYIVYTDNYDALLNVKNRAVVAKLIYWLSI